MAASAFSNAFTRAAIRRTSSCRPLSSKANTMRRTSEDAEQGVRQQSPPPPCLTSMEAVGWVSFFVFIKFSRVGMRPHQRCARKMQSDPAVRPEWVVLLQTVFGTREPMSLCRLESTSIQMLSRKLNKPSHAMGVQRFARVPAFLRLGHARHRTPRLLRCQSLSAWRHRFPAYLYRLVSVVGWRCFSFACVFCTRDPLGECELVEVANHDRFADLPNGRIQRNKVKIPTSPDEF